MVTGLEGAATVAGVAGLVGLILQLVESCYQGFELLSRARECRREVSTFRLMLEIELTKLFVWADEAGLNSKPPLLHIGLQYAPLVPKVLEELHHLLNDTHVLQSKYRLQLDITHDEIIDLEHDGSAFHRLDLISQADVEDCKRTMKTIFDNRVKPWKRLQWVMIDERRFEKLLKRIDFLTCQLRFFLETGRRQSIEARYEALIRAAVMNTENEHDLSFLSRYDDSTNSPTRDIQDLKKLSLSSRTTLNSTAIAATARLKQKGLRLGFFKRWNNSGNLEVTPVQSSSAKQVHGYQDGALPRLPMRLNPKLLKFSKSSQRYLDRQPGWYNGDPILLEWRMMDRARWDQMEVRVEKLSYLLQQMTDRSFHSLPCRGWVSIIDTGRYGYVFDLPSPTPEAPLSSPQPQTLRNALETSPSSPSLNLKLMYATTLMETVLQLHTAGWLHKQIWSDNVLIFGQVPDYSNSTAWTLSSLDEQTSCYLAGYTYTRADDPQDFTETIRSSQEMDIYRHPQSFLNPYSSSTGRSAQYRISFDIFSLGCILLEIGLWSSLPTILRRLVPSISVDTGRNMITSRKRTSITGQTAAGEFKPVPGKASDDSLGDAVKPLPILPLTRYEDESFTNCRGSSTLMSARSLLLKQLQHEHQAPSATSASSSPDGSLSKVVLHHLTAQTGKKYASIVADFLLVDTCHASDEAVDAKTDHVLRQNNDTITKIISNEAFTTETQVVEESMRALALETRALARLKNLAEAL